MKHRHMLTAVVLAMAMVPFAAQAEEAEGNHEKVFWEKSDCANPPGGPAIHVSLSEVKNGEGNIRLALYNMDEDEFLASGARIARIDVGAVEGDMEVCLPLPRTGAFAMAVLHDEDADGKLDVFSEGYGFPNDPKLFFSPPDAEEASFTAQDGETVSLPIRMRYVYPNSSNRRDNRGPRR